MYVIIYRMFSYSLDALMIYKLYVIRTIVKHLNFVLKGSVILYISGNDGEYYTQLTNLSKKSSYAH